MAASPENKSSRRFKVGKAGLSIPDRIPAPSSSCGHLDITPSTGGEAVAGGTLVGMRNFELNATAAAPRSKCLHRKDAAADNRAGSASRHCPRLGQKPVDSDGTCRKRKLFPSLRRGNATMTERHTTNEPTEVLTPREARQGRLGRSDCFWR